MISLRDYQTELIAGIREQFRHHRRVLAVSPTGSGKTVTFAFLTSATADKGNSVIIVAHRQEIVDQISRALDEMGVRHGRIQPGHSMTDDLVQVAMVQTLARRLGDIVPPRFLIVDEAHHAVAGTWATVSAAFPAAFVLGVTATPERLDGRGLGDAFDALVLGPAVATLMDRGFLARYRYLAPPTTIDLSAIKKRHGDYAVDELAAAMDKATITGDAVDHYRRHLDGRPAIAFCVTVAHAEHVAEQFNAAGYRAASVDGKMGRVERRDRMTAIGDGRLHVLTSCDLISEGVDVPVVAGAILLRPTASLGLYLQQVGRALRPKPDGGAAVILDHVGNFSRHGLPDAARVWTLDAKKRKPGAPPIVQCEVCYRIFDAAEAGWRESVECQEGLPAECALVPASAGGGGAMAPEVVDGTLVDVGAPVPASAAPDPVMADWSHGVCIVTGPYKEVVRMARTEDQLMQLAIARGYSPGWVRRIMGFRGRYRGPEELAFTPRASGALASAGARDELEALLS